MPTYSYRCRDCDTAFDIQQAFTDDTLTVCPNCGGSLRKVFSPVGVTFNGSGFYRTDSRASATSGSGSASGSGSGASSSSESSSSTSSTPSTSSTSSSSSTGTSGSSASKAGASSS